MTTIQSRCPLVQNVLLAFSTLFSVVALTIGLRAMFAEDVK